MRGRWPAARATAAGPNQRLGPTAAGRRAAGRRAAVRRAAGRRAAERLAAERLAAGTRRAVVAELWSEVLDSLEWRGRFTHVIFAVPQGAHGRSIAVFRRALCPLAP